MLPTNRTFAEHDYALWSRYGMWDAENDDDAAFERRMASVVREVGERGKLIVAESVPPVRTGEDEELAAIEDKVADAIGFAGVDDGAESAWGCVMQLLVRVYYSQLIHN